MRNRAKIPQLSWIHRGQENAWILSRELSNHLISRCNRDACAPLCFSLLSSPPSSLFSGRALWSDQTSFRFRLSVSARFVSCTLRSPHPRRTQGEQEATRMVLEMIVESMRNFPASRRDLFPPFEPPANSVNCLLFFRIETMKSADVEFL